MCYVLCLNFINFVEKIGKILEDRDAVKFTDKLYGVYEDYQSSLKKEKSRKRKVSWPFTTFVVG